MLSAILLIISIVFEESANNNDYLAYLEIKVWSKEIWIIEETNDKSGVKKL